MDQLLCYCYVVTEREVREAIVAHQLLTVEAVVERTGAGRGCRTCWFDIEDLLIEIWGKEAVAEAARRAAAPPY